MNELNPRALKFLQLIAKWADAPTGPEKDRLCAEANEALAECSDEDKREMQSKLGQYKLAEAKAKAKAALIKDLENILTIDGRGRPAKARALLKIMIDVDDTTLAEALAEIGDRKFF